MKRTVLLLEPNYKNKYPPMGLMKLATYFRKHGDCVRFFKGDLRDLALENLFERFWAEYGNPLLFKQVDNIKKYIKTGKHSLLDTIDNPSLIASIELYRSCFQRREWKIYDVICVTTLFTFYWDITISTINDAKAFLNDTGKLLLGGITASILHQRILDMTGIMPHIGLLDRPGLVDSDSDEIIDELSLDYSILEEIEYTYPSANSYFGYMTRGCPRKCPFCAVPVLEPEYRDYISIRKQVAEVSARFGERRDLLLLDNNVLVSKCFDKIIDDIKDIGFAKGSFYIPPDEYEITLNNLRDNYNTRAYLRKMIKLYDTLAVKLDDDTIGDFFIERERLGLVRYETATLEAIENLDGFVAPLFAKHFKHKPLVRYIDFNQGVDLRLLTSTKAKRLAETSIRPLRIAFDDWSLHVEYEKSVRAAANEGITELSNYLLYNSDTDNDTPLNLYRRMRINVDLCEELDISTYSFPMKYHPIDHPEYFNNRDYIGTHWNRQYIRAIQAVLNSTHGKIGRGISFFNEAFGANEEEFQKIIIMPEALIVHRMKYKDNVTAEWWSKWTALSDEQRDLAKPIIFAYNFTDTILDSVNDTKVREVLHYYQIRRNR